MMSLVMKFTNQHNDGMETVERNIHIKRKMPNLGIFSRV